MTYKHDRWHQDIKPANILVVSGSGTSSSDVYFKIADLSRCHFKESLSLQHEDSDLDAFGTRAYGSPGSIVLCATLGLHTAQVLRKPSDRTINTIPSPYK